jgi:hypothetical protein
MSNEETFGSDSRLGCPFFTLGMGRFQGSRFGNPRYDGGAATRAETLHALRACPPPAPLLLPLDLVSVLAAPFSRWEWGRFQGSRFGNPRYDGRTTTYSRALRAFATPPSAAPFLLPLKTVLERAVWSAAAFCRFGGHGPTKMANEKRLDRFPLGRPFFTLGMGRVQGSRFGNPRYDGKGGDGRCATTPAPRRIPSHCAHLRPCSLLAPHLLPLGAAVARSSLECGYPGTRQASVALEGMTNEDANEKRLDRFPSWLPLFHVGSGPASREQVWKPALRCAALRRRRHDVFQVIARITSWRYDGGAALRRGCYDAGA